MEDKFEKYKFDPELNQLDDTCDLDPNKICDNCGKCIEDNTNYKIIKITKFEKDN